MLSVDIETGEIKELSERAAEAAEGKHGIEAALDNLKQYFIERLKRETELVRWRGVLTSSVQILEELKNGFVVGPNPSAADNVDDVLYGTPPHTPPFAPLHAWAQSKLGATEEVTWKIWQGIRVRGTSVWATAQGWGTGGENPFVNRVAEDEATESMLEKTASDLGTSIIMQLIGAEDSWQAPGQQLELPGGEW